MIYNKFQDDRLSMLGFGAMRLPTSPDGSIDEQRTEDMVDYAILQGVNYFDTAYPYHNGMSEIVMGRILKKYPRDSYRLATKYPGHQISSSYNPAAVFEHQLEKCGVEYFDYYLLHNVNEVSISVYTDPRWGILDYFKKQRENGRIKHLGFSTHAMTEGLRTFLDIAGDDMEFCQIQLNWVDWTLQDARGKVRLLNERGIPIWVMEPVRGGKLCRLSEKNEARLKAIEPGRSVASWGFRFLEDIPGVTVVLSGMSDMSQAEDNLRTYAAPAPLCDSEREILFDIAEELKESVPCTGCGYCMADCPMGLDIPFMISTYNELKFAASANPAMRIENMPDEKKPSVCLSCGMCSKICPQCIDIPGVMRQLSDKLDTIPKWSEICRKREEDAKKLAENKR